MGTWIPLALPDLIQQHWLPQQQDENLTERVVTQAENALHKRRKQALHHRAPLPMGVCINPTANQHHVSSRSQDVHDDHHDDHHDMLDDDAIDHDEDPMSDSDFADMSVHDERSQTDPSAAAAAADDDEHLHDDDDDDDDDEDEDDDDDIARFL